MFFCFCFFLLLHTMRMLHTFLLVYIKLLRTFTDRVKYELTDTEAAIYDVLEAKI